MHDAVGYANAAEVTDAMALRQDDFTPDQRDYFDLLCSLLEKRDRNRPALPKLTVKARLKHLMEEAGMSAADLSRFLGEAGISGR